MTTLYMVIITALQLVDTILVVVWFEALQICCSWHHDNNMKLAVNSVEIWLLWLVMCILGEVVPFLVKLLTI